MRILLFKLNMFLRLTNLLNLVYPNQVLTKYNNPDSALAVCRQMVKSLGVALERPELAGVKEDLERADCFSNLKARVA